MNIDSVSLILSALSIHLLAVISPGPDFFMLIKNALGYSRKTGYYTAMGFGLGIGVHVTYCIFGLGLILKNSPSMFLIITLMGAFYLAYIGIMSFRATDSKFNVQEKQLEHDISPAKAVRIGFITNVLNPKATLFFLSLFTIVIGPNTAIPIAIFAGLLMMVNTTLWFIILAYLVTHKSILPFLEKNQGLLNKFFGAVLIFISLKILMDTIPPYWASM